MSKDFDALFNAIIGTIPGFDPFARRPVNYPPYSIINHGESTDEAGAKTIRFEVKLAVAGFKQDELSLLHDGQRLYVKGKATPDEANINYIHRGIARRSFGFDIGLGNNVDVEQAALRDGILSIILVQRMPAPKPVALLAE